MPAKKPAKRTKKTGPRLAGPSVRRKKPFKFRSFIFKPRQRPVVFGEKVFALETWRREKSRHFFLLECTKGAAQTGFLAIAGYAPLSSKVKIPGVVASKAWVIEAGVIAKRLAAEEQHIFPWLVRQVVRDARQKGIRFLVVDPYPPREAERWRSHGFRQAGKTKYLLRKLQ